MTRIWLSSRKATEKRKTFRTGAGNFSTLIIKVLICSDLLYDCRILLQFQRTWSGHSDSNEKKFLFFIQTHLLLHFKKWRIVLKSLPLHAMMLPCFLLMWGDSGGLGSNKSLLPWPKRNLMIQERNGREVEYPLLCTLDREPQMRFISIKPFTSVLKIIAQSLYLTSTLAKVHIPHFLPWELFYTSISQVNRVRYSLDNCPWV